MSQTQTNRRAAYVRSLDRVKQLSDAERAKLRPVVEQYPFRANDYYLGLIDWSDPHDPIRQLVVPREEELADWGRLDASNEASVTVGRGIQHKYRDTVLLLCNEVCGAYCRYCFRKRLFMDENDEVTNDLTEALRYIAEHPEVTNVLLSGGDPLIMNTRRIATILRRLREIPHVKIIRLGTKMPAFNPYRILDDSELQQVFSEVSMAHQRLYLMTHFDHPRELTGDALRGLDAVLRQGVVCANQCPLIKGVNDDPRALAEMFSTLANVGCPQYYIFQCRPTSGNEPYQVPLVRSWHVFQEALSQGAGLARRARFVMSHESGKVEVLAIDKDFMYLRYHQAKEPRDQGRFFVCYRNDHACWLDHLQPVHSLQAVDGDRSRRALERIGHRRDGILT